MLALDRDALMCDMAETYQIYDMRSLSPRIIAVFACGLGIDSRIMLKKSGSRISLEKMMLAAILDDLNLLLWTRSQEETAKPASIVTALIGARSEDNSQVDPMTPEEFERIRKEFYTEKEEEAANG